MGCCKLVFFVTTLKAGISCTQFDSSQRYTLSCMESSGHGEDLSVFSLLQTSLDIKHEPIKRRVAENLPQTLPVKEEIAQQLHHKFTQQRSTKESAYGLPSFSEDQKNSDQHHKQTLALTFVSTMSRLSGLPLAAVIIVILAVLVIGVLIFWNILVDNQDDMKEYGRPYPQRQRYSQGGSNGQMDQSFIPQVSRQGRNEPYGSSGNIITPPSQQVFRGGSPNVTAVEPGVYLGQRTPTATARTPSSHNTPLRPVVSPNRSVTRSATPEDGCDLQAVAMSNTPQICPALILPGNDSPMFSLPVYSISKLRSGGNAAVEILGPSGRPLLHARCSNDGTIAAVSAEFPNSGPWLELSTTPKSRHPHAILGPLGATSGLVIFGPGGGKYGTMDSARGAWRVDFQGMPVLTISPGSGCLLSVTSPDNQSIATLLRENDKGVDSYVLQVNPGHDALLTLLCTLAVLINGQF